ncbi:MAG TPA: tRNA (adenosine(37)-N6)-dimethylallyltransferase MiaA [Candidatus Agathobaculum intestinigallinarum]|nr:tRNA (adenosine(37)-N6)-dimethylallyltransferase MiaA [Candidatus Agathobaculum intestinigallinarum]
MENRLICICGPTASGKTALSVALAKQLHTEIISADSMQIYRGMDIGTAKPTAEERQGVPHHLLDVCAPGEPFSVARYVELADAAAQDVLSRGMIPVVAGGTGLYMDALIECSTFSGDETDLSVREKYQRMAAERGNEAVHACLARVDPEGAERLHPNNLKRVIRALEVYEQTGMTIDAFNRLHKRPAPKYAALKIGVCPAERQTLYDRIDRRVDQMLADGLLEETKRLLDSGALAGTAAQAIGYKELLGYLQGDAPLADCVALLKQRSRNYAKRQLTWLKRDDNIHWIYYNNGEELPAILQEATEYLQKHGVQ